MIHGFINLLSVGADEHELTTINTPQALYICTNVH
jgi:hypothetical protein